MDQKNAGPGINGPKQGNSPVHTVNYGAVRVAVWCEHGKNGPWYYATASKSYKDKDGNWQRGAKFFVEDMLTLANALTAAFAFCQDSRRRDNQAKKQQASAPDEPYDCGEIQPF